MLATIQRVNKASVFIGKKQYSSISQGIVIFLCAESSDSERNVKKMFNSIFNFKILEGDSSIMSASLKELKEDVLIVSQFTLAAITNKGTRASFHKAAKASEAKLLYEQFVNLFKGTECKIATGVFGENMNVEIINKGPVTFNFKT